MYARLGSGLGSVAASGGQPEQLTSPDSERGETAHAFPEALPEGRGVLLDVVSSEGRSIAVLDPETGQHRVVIPGGSGAHYP